MATPWSDCDSVYFASLLRRENERTMTHFSPLVATAKFCDLVVLWQFPSEAICFRIQPSDFSQTQLCTPNSQRCGHGARGLSPAFSARKECANKADIASGENMILHESPNPDFSIVRALDIMYAKPRNFADDLLLSKLSQLSESWRRSLASRATQNSRINDAERLTGQ